MLFIFSFFSKCKIQLCSCGLTIWPNRTASCSHKHHMDMLHGPHHRVHISYYVGGRLFFVTEQHTHTVVFIISGLLARGTCLAEIDVAPDSFRLVFNDARSTLSIWRRLIQSGYMAKTMSSYLLTHRPCARQGKLCH